MVNVPAGLLDDDPRVRLSMHVFSSSKVAWVDIVPVLTVSPPIPEVTRRSTSPVIAQVEEGTPQGGSASAQLANVYLHYAFDLWVRAWRGKQARGDPVAGTRSSSLVYQTPSMAYEGTMLLTHESALQPAESG